MEGPRAVRSFRSLIAFARDRRGASAVEFSIVSIPFIFVLLMILQMAIYYMTQSSLDAGVIAAADTLVNNFYSTTGVFVTPTASGLKTSVYTKSGGLIRNDTTLKVELRQFSTLGAAPVPITDGFIDAGVPKSVLALRAQASVITFMPGLASSGLSVVRSSALIRRQGF